MSTIRFHYQPTLTDFLAFDRYFTGRHYRLLTFVAIVSVILLLLLPAALHRTGHKDNTLDIYWSNAGLLIIPAAAILLIPARYLSVRSRWNKVEEVRIQREYEIGETGIRVTGSSLAGFLEWRHIVQADFKSGYFFLKTAQNQYYYFPATAVPEKSAFVELVARKVPVSKTWMNA